MRSSIFCPTARSSWILGYLIGLCLPAEASANPFAHARLELHGTYRDRADGRREEIGYLAVAIPVSAEAYTKARLAQVTPSPRPEDPLDAMSESPFEVPRSSDPLVDGSVEPPIDEEQIEDGEVIPADPPTQLPARVRVVSPLNRELAMETLDAAFRANGVHASLSRLESLSTKARTSAALPDLRVRAGRELDQSLRLTPTQADPYRYAQTDGVNNLVEASLTWRLGELVFGTEELGLERLRLLQAKERQRLASQVLLALFAWNRAWIRVANREISSPEAEVRLLEATLRLDSMTGGWFSGDFRSAAPPALPTSKKVDPTAKDRALAKKPKPR